MTENGEEKSAFSVRTAEIVVAAGFLVLGAIVVFDSLRLGIGWQEDGPKAGYFPFYIGAIICISALINLVAALAAAKSKGATTFVEAGQLKLVLSVLVPTGVYVALIGWIGIYVASILFIALVMRWLARTMWKLARCDRQQRFFSCFEVWLSPRPRPSRGLPG